MIGFIPATSGLALVFIEICSPPLLSVFGSRLFIDIKKAVGKDIVMSNASTTPSNNGGSDSMPLEFAWPVDAGETVQMVDVADANRV